MSPLLALVSAFAFVTDCILIFLLTVSIELGGGSGRKLGKDNAKHMIESFGGRVTQQISGATC